MGKLDQPGYPLPPGELGEDEIVCQLVFLPDRPEYWQAFIAAYHYMTTWRAWERDSDKRGRDAAANWRSAFELTMECWRMACLDDLQQDVSDILAFLQSNPPCCDGIDITDGDQYTDSVEDGVGDVPQNVIDAGYASGASDWSGFDDYKCMICHVTVDQLSARLNELAPYVDTAGVIIGGFATVAVVVTTIFTGGLTAMAWGIIASTGIVAFLYQIISDGSLLETLADKVDTNHDELACAMYNSDGNEGALIALNDKIDELFTAPEALILKNMNLGPTVKALYSGRYDQQDMADILLDAGYELINFTCDCDQIGEYMTFTDFETEGNEGWERIGGWIIEEGMGGGWAFRKSMNESSHELRHSVGTLCDVLSLPHPSGTKVWINRLKFWYRMSGDTGQQIRVTCHHDGGSEQNFYGYTDAWVEKEIIYDPPLESTYNRAEIVEFNHSGSGYYLYVDNITVDFDHLSG